MTRHFPNHQPIAFHASEIRSGRDFWRKVSDDKRSKVLSELCQVVTNRDPKRSAVYAVAVEKSKTLYGEAAVEKATEEICRRFDIYLTRQFQNNNDAQRG